MNAETEENQSGEYAIKRSQLSGVHVATFNCPELGITNLKLPVPAVPEVISTELAERVKSRASHDRKNNKQGRRRSLLTGFVRCARCRMSLTSPTNGKVRYRHNSRDGKYCDPSVNGEMLERHVLDFLYRFFLDEKAFNEAVKRKMPTADDRGRLVRDANRAKKQLLRVNRTIANLVDAIGKAILDGVSDMLNNQGWVTGLKVSDHKLAALQLTKHKAHGITPSHRESKMVHVTYAQILRAC